VAITVSPVLGLARLAVLPRQHSSFTHPRCRSPFALETTPVWVLPTVAGLTGLVSVSSVALRETAKKQRQDNIDPQLDEPSSLFDPEFARSPKTKASDIAATSNVLIKQAPSSASVDSLMNALDEYMDALDRQSQRSTILAGCIGLAAGVASGLLLNSAK